MKASGPSSNVPSLGRNRPVRWLSGATIADGALAAVASETTQGSCHAETALYWAASSDDVEVARALIDAGADIEAPGASIAGGVPLDDAVGYGCWQVVQATRRWSAEKGAFTGSKAV
jgi:hypothetical protein